MAKVGILADTGSDILQFPELKKQLDVEVIYLLINIGNETFTDKTMSLDELLERMETADKDTWPKTSQPSVGQFVERYEELKAQGFTDIISVHVGSELSGTINSARLASEQVEELNVYIVDSQSASIGVIPTIKKVRELLDNGHTPEEVQTIANLYAKEIAAYAAVPKLDNLYKGGRLKPLKFFLGRLLNFKPILRIKQGAIESVDKTRNLVQTQDKSYEYALENFSQEDDFEFVIAHAWSEDLATKYAEKFEQDFPDKKYYVGKIGPTISVHLGPEGIVFSVIKR